MNLKVRQGISISLLPLFIFQFLFCVNHSLEGGEKVESHTLQSEQTEIHFLSNDCKNKKKLLVFIHGSPGSSSDFLSYLNDKDLQTQFCILVPDRLGYGQSMNQVSFPDIFTQGKAIHAALLNYFKKESHSFTNGYVVGHSYGGPVSLVIAMEKDPSYPIVWKCILLSSPADPNLEELYWYNKLASVMFVKWILPKSWVHSNEEMYTLKSDLEKLTTILGNYPLDILSVHGEMDKLVPLENIYYFTKWKPMIKHKIQILEGENHFIPWTSFAEIKEILLTEGS
ncbi:alpha/beta fold hydrolase [Leptospira vanthielii]|uniref:Alpha/beta fold hydrolase n=1 Tax=Leptospira vanthielii TaxID=293085 RepID=A0ABY2NT38_9LEPT|nr:alpha/beta fold hydrolase [Leptospira vanthielii]TGM60786.1 alpha/beta fold hydrolase [Leptospira vanthielii]